MSDHVFRNPDLFEQRPERDFIRKHCPNGSDGFVAEDLDLVLRVYGTAYDSDATGKFRLIEVKHSAAPLGRSKIRTFQLIDSILQSSERYDGFYVIRADTSQWEEATEFTVNGWDLEVTEFIAWLNFRLAIPRMWAPP